LHAYPVVERGPFLWIWPGDSAAARSAEIPALAWLTDPNFAHVEGYHYVDSSYVMLHENVLDMTHASFLHGAAAASIDYARVPPEVTIEDDTVSISRTERGTLAPPFYEAAMGRFGHRVDRATTSVFATPGVHFAHDVIVDLEASAGERARFLFEYVHAFTPATQTSSHYFWSNARDSGVDDIRVSEFTKERSTGVYFEDAEALEWAQTLRLAESPAEISVLGDKAGIQMRRILQRLALAESPRRTQSD
jgi:vanillate O-demethylase monooxygenase subunit